MLKNRIWHHIILTLITLLCSTAYLFSQEWQIAKHAGGTGNDISMTVANDVNGNIYFGGAFTGTAQFDSAAITSNGSDDYFFAKYDPSGNLIWLNNGGGITTGLSSGDYVADIYISNNNILVTGSFNDNTSFGNQNLSCSGFANVFIARYDSAGNCIWAKKIGGSSIDHGNKIVVDINDNIYVCGGSTSASLQAGSITIPINGHRFFLAKLDMDGNFKWLKSISGSGWLEPFDMVYFNNSIYLTGDYTGSVSLGSISLSTNKSWLPYIVKMDTSGNGIWANSYVCNDYGGGYSLDISNNGYLYCGGRITGSMVINSDTVKNTGGFLIKSDTNGNTLWLRPMGSIDRCVKVTGDETIFTAGTFAGSSKFADCEINVTNDVSRMYIAKINSSGECNGVTQVENIPFVSDISLDYLSQLYVTGYCDSTDFGSIHVGNYGDADAFWAKLDYVSGMRENKGPGGNTLYIYANPNTGVLNIDVPQEVMNERGLTLKIFDNSNRLVKQQTLDMTEDALHVVVPESKPGIYFLQLISKKKIYSGKMVVQ